MLNELTSLKQLFTGTELVNFRMLVNPHHEAQGKLHEVGNIEFLLWTQ